MKKNWLIALYKTNEIKILEGNLLNQNFEYYLPKITSKKLDSIPKEEVLFPGYIFVNIGLENYSALKYTKGIKEIIKFGNNISCMSNEEIQSIKMVEEKSKIHPVASQIQIGQDALIAKGSFKGNIVKICSLSSKERVEVLLTFLGSIRRVSISIKALTY